MLEILWRFKLQVFFILVGLALELSFPIVGLIFVLVGLTPLLPFIYFEEKEKINPELLKNCHGLKPIKHLEGKK